MKFEKYLISIVINILRVTVNYSACMLKSFSRGLNHSQISSKKGCKYNHMSLMAFTAHYINDFPLHLCVISCRPLRVGRVMFLQFSSKYFG